MSPLHFLKTIKAKARNIRRRKIDLPIARFSRKRILHYEKHLLYPEIVDATKIVASMHKADRKGKEEAKKMMDELAIDTTLRALGAGTYGSTTNFNELWRHIQSRKESLKMVGRNPSSDEYFLELEQEAIDTIGSANYYLFCADYPQVRTALLKTGQRVLQRGTDIKKALGEERTRRKEARNK